MPVLNVEIVSLEPMTVAYTCAFGESPEGQALKRLREWAEPKGLLDDLDEHPVFGFNNPSPTPGNNEYGYEFWIRVPSSEAAEGDIEVKDFPGGLYAVTRCQLAGEPNVFEAWRLLWEWVQSSEYHWRETHELEKLMNPSAPEGEIELELYLPIEESAA